MALPMSRPWKHPKTQIYWLRKRVPADLRLIIGKLEEKQSLRTRDATEAKLRHSAALIAIEERWAAARAELANRPSDKAKLQIDEHKVLSERDAHEHATWMQTYWLQKHRDNPSRQTFWRTDLYDRLWASTLALGTEADKVSVSDKLAIAKLEAWCLDQADDLAALRDWILDEASRRRLAKALSAAVQRASLNLARHSEGYVEELGQGATGAQVHPFQPASKVAYLIDLFDEWALERRPAIKTLYEWKRTVEQFAAFVGKNDASKFTADEVLLWKNGLVAGGLAPNTINGAKLAPLRTILQWAVDNKRISLNPAVGIGVEVKRRAGEGIRSFSDSEAAHILREASQQANPVLRWVPWISAYTGARISEICQLRVQDLAVVEGVWAIKFDPEAGSLKNQTSERIVPMHPALVESGLTGYATDAPAGPLFPNLPPDKFGKRGGNGTKVVGRWVRSLGLIDKRLSPTHSWRHRLRTSARRYGLAIDLVDAIAGHARKNVADRYGEYPVPALLRELSKIPAIRLSTEETETV